ncbi:MAG: DUF1150 family protein [Alphaproteobacteria bacterium]|jgi:hypothetical protein|nr:DUF1150 family protein [Alphaproteobacteria bacterium]
MTDLEDFPEIEENGFDQGPIAYIKPTGSEEARRLGIIPPGIQLPAGATLYVLHAMDGSVLGYMDSWDGAYGAAVQNEMTPVAVH